MTSAGGNGTGEGAAAGENGAGAGAAAGGNGAGRGAGGTGTPRNPWGAGTPGTEELVHRGVRWRRSPSGRTMWYNEGLRRWTLWSPGSDAPPVPSEWGPVGPVGPVAEDLEVHAEAGDGGAAVRPKPGLLRYLPDDAMARRPPMRSPYRIVPIVVAVFIVGVAVYQATRPPSRATKQDIAAAEALNGKCLARSGGNAEFPDYSGTPVSCSSKQAAVRVIKVVVPGKPVSCPTDSLEARVVDIGAVGEPAECLVNVRKP